MKATRIQLTADGPEFSRLVMGVMRFRQQGLTGDRLREFVEACLDLGITTFDHADIYGSYTIEELFGDALAGAPSLRGRMELVSKCDIMLVSPQRPGTRIHHYDTSKAHIIASAERSLRHLRTDYLDLLLIHRPDPLMDADEVADALTELRQSGKILHAGVSNFSPYTFDLLASRLSFPLVTNQIELSPLHLSPLHDGTLDHLQRLRVPPMIWSPFGGGSLFSGSDERSARVRDVLGEIAAARRATTDQIVLAWLYALPSRVLPVLGTGKLERVHAAVAAESIRLDRQEWFAIWEASTGHEVP